MRVGGRHRTRRAAGSAGVRRRRLHRTSARRPPRASARLFSVLAVVAAGFAAWCAPALALSQRGHSFQGSFGSKGEALGQLSGPAGVAVNQTTGDVYVLDAGNQRVERFNEKGEALQVWGWGVETGAAEYQQCASVCKAGIAGTGEGQLDYPAKLKRTQRAAIALAVDNSKGASKGDVYVVSNTVSEENVIEKFSASGERLGRLEVVGSQELGGVAVDAQGEVWVLSRPFELLKRFDGTLENKPLPDVVIEGSETQELACLAPGLAVDGAGTTAYVNHEELTANLELCPAEEEEEFREKEKEEKEEGKEPIKRGKVTGVSVTAKLNITEAEPPVAQLAALALDHENTTAVASDLSNGDVYLDNATTVAAFDAGGALIQRFGAGTLSAGAGIAVNAATNNIYVADFKKDRIDLFAPEAAGAPTVDEVSSQDLTPTSTRLEALVDPHGSHTHVYFQYATVPNCQASSSCTDLPAAPGIDIGSGFGDVLVTEEAQNLQPGTTYYFQVIAENDAKEKAEGSAVLHTFTTLPAAAGLLADQRAWEMVSPANKEGAAIEGIGGIGGGSPSPSVGFTASSEDGSAITYSANAPTESRPEGNRAPEAQQIISSRAPAGWSSKDIATPNLKGQGLNAGGAEEYQFFSSDLSFGLLLPWGLSALQEPPLVHELNGVPVAEEQRGIYRRRNLDPSCETPPASCYEPLVTAANDAVSPSFGGGLEILDASPDLHHVVFRSEPPLVAGAPTHSLYEWNDGVPPSEQLKIVDVLPGGEVPTQGNEAGLGAEQEKATDARNAISRDGSRIFWTYRTQLYMRDMVNGRTLDVSAPEAGVGAVAVEEAPGRYESTSFQTASTDGSRVFFTDKAPLTLESTLKPQAPTENGTGPTDLYVCEVVEAGGELKCNLKDLTVDQHANLGESADVPNLIPGASDDGSYVYFVANGVLAPGAAPGGCGTQHNQIEPPPGATCNLYVDHYATGKWEAPKLVARLSAQDKGDWGAEQIRLFPTSSRVSPNGRYLAFMSNRPLTGYDNRDRNSGAPDEEVFLYDAFTERVVCASCNPSGARPAGVFDTEDAGEGAGLLVDRSRAWQGSWLAGSLPSWTWTSEPETLYQSRYLSDEGRLFFNSPDELVTLPAGETFVHKENVYEYEPAGLGTCESASGCVALISSGTSDRESAFLDASTNGDSVFFMTAGRLVPSDQDGSFDVYDARVCTPASPCITPPPPAPPQCTSTDECRLGNASVPASGTPASSTFSGPGNIARQETRKSTEAKPPVHKKLTRKQLLAKALRACRKHANKKRRVACERAAHKRFGPKKKPHHHSGGSKR
jgi:DNA-binding beta-propeller fold protein YncE